jgi:hypothetical protein
LFSRADDFDEFGVSPDALDRRVLFDEEFSETLNSVILEIPFKHFSIRQLYFPSPLFCVLHQHPFVVLPVVFKQVKVGEIKPALQSNGVVVVYFSESVELILTPVAFICQFSSFVKKFAPTVHFVVFPLAFVVTSVLVEELSVPVSLAIQFVALVPRASFVLLNDVLMVGEVDRDVSISDS